jgi:hypothetical protein
LLLLGRGAEARRDFDAFLQRNPQGQRNLELLIQEAERARDNLTPAGTPHHDSL